MLLLGVLIILLIVGFNASTYDSKQIEIVGIDGIDVDSVAASQRLSEAIQLATISYQSPSDFEAEPFLQLHQLMADRFPFVERVLEKKAINTFSLLYKWPGKDISLKPVTFLAHLDVVPAEQETLQQWAHAPFSGYIAEGFIWGRGAIDDKASAFALLEAVEHLLALGFEPNRTIYLAFGHDEEVGGVNGAAKIAEYFQQQSIHSLFTLDEGMIIADAQLSPIKQKLAVVGIAEKGYVSVRLTAKAESGHSSMPSKNSSVIMLSEAVLALQKNQMPSSLEGVGGLMFEYIGPEMDIISRMIFANQWLFDGLIMSKLEANKSTAAMIRTTTAVTFLQAGMKENIIPSQATAVVNFRVQPGNTLTQLLDHMAIAIDNPSIELEVLTPLASSNASAISAIDNAEFLLLEQTIKQIYPKTLFSPGLVVGGTDSRHYEEVADNNYRFLPYLMGPDDLSRVHGVNERMGLDAYAMMIKFYAQLMKNIAVEQ